LSMGGGKGGEGGVQIKGIEGFLVKGGASGIRERKCEDTARQ